MVCMCTVQLAVASLKSVWYFNRPVNFRFLNPDRLIIWSLIKREQALFNLEIKRKSGPSINPDIHHSKVPSSELITVAKLSKKSDSKILNSRPPVNKTNHYKSDLLFKNDPLMYKGSCESKQVIQANQVTRLIRDKYPLAWIQAGVQGYATRLEPSHKYKVWKSNTCYMLQKNV